MEKNRYKILQKTLQSVELVSLTGQTWYDSNHDLYPWSGTTVGPEIGDVIFNVTGGTVPSGYYKWTESTWVSITKPEVYENHNILLYLENTVDELGVMVGFNGDMEQVEQLCNFTYSGVTNSYHITIFNSVNEDKLRSIVEQNFTIDWGDGTTSTIGSTTFSQTGHTYSTIPSGKTYEVSIYLNSPWTTQKLTKPIYIPIKNTNTIANEFGTFTGYTIPTGGLSGSTFSQDYLNDLDLYTGATSGATFTYVAIGGSKIDQKILYGETIPMGITTGTTEGLNWSGYTIDDFYYRDYSDGYTMITGSTNGFPKEEIPNLCLTRNEHFIGFVDEPTIYSDIFVERGKQGVMEKNLRLCELDNIGEVELYGNGYFNVKKQ